MFWIKAFLSGLIIAAAAKISEKSGVWGALLVALPLVSLLTMSLMWVEKKDAELVAVHAESTFWLVLPSMPMFLLLPRLMRHEWGYWSALAVCSFLTVLLYLLMAQLMKSMGMGF